MRPNLLALGSHCNSTYLVNCGVRLQNEIRLVVFHSHELPVLRALVVFHSSGDQNQPLVFVINEDSPDEHVLSAVHRILFDKKARIYI